LISRSYLRSAWHAEHDILCYAIRISSRINLCFFYYFFPLEECRNKAVINSKASKLTPVENQSPSGVGVTRDLIASAIDTAVDAAEDLPHFWMSAPPRCLDIRMKRIMVQP
jgi:hypothetical protein